VTGALMNAVLLRKKRDRQLSFDFDFTADAKAIDILWRDAEEGERRSRARFAQNAIKPEEVAPEWQSWRELLGGPEEVRRFVERAMSRLDAPLQQGRKGFVLAHLGALPVSLKERLSARGMRGTVKLAFEEPPPAGAEIVTRSHPLPATLAEALIEGALDPDSSTVKPLGRQGAWPSTAVSRLTTVALLRLRYKLTVHGRKERLLLVEEAGAVALGPDADRPVAEGKSARALLETEPSGDLADLARQRLLAEARRRLDAALAGSLADHARERAGKLSQDHARVRATGVNVSRVSVEPVLPADVIGLFVLVPAGP